MTARAPDICTKGPRLYGPHCPHWTKPEDSCCYCTEGFMHSADGWQLDDEYHCEACGETAGPHRMGMCP